MSLLHARAALPAAAGVPPHARCRPGRAAARAARGDRGRARARREPTSSVLYDNWFIETCDEWVVPYIGDLLGVRPIRAVESAGVSARAYVANTIAYRRRKGTAVVLEQLARDVTGWPARAVEFFTRLATDAAHEPRAARAAGHAERARRGDGRARRRRRSIRSRTRSKCAMRRRAAGASTSRTSASICGGCAATRSAPAHPGDESPDFASARDLGALVERPSGRLDSPLFNRAAHRDDDHPPRRGGERSRRAAPPRAERRARTPAPGHRRRRRRVS